MALALALALLSTLSLPAAVRAQLNCPPAAAAAAAKLPAAFIGLGHSASSLLAGLPALVAVQGNQVVETLMVPSATAGCLPSTAYGYIITTCIGSAASLAATTGTAPKPARAVAYSGNPALVTACHFFVNGPAGSGTVLLNYSKPGPAGSCPYNVSTSSYTGPFQHTLTGFNASAPAAAAHLKCPPTNVVPTELLGNASYLGTTANPVPAGIVIFSLSRSSRSTMLYLGVVEFSLCAVRATFRDLGGSSSIYEVQYGAFVPTGALGFAAPLNDEPIVLHCEWLQVAGTALNVLSFSADIESASSKCPTSLADPGLNTFSLPNYFPGGAPNMLPSASPTPSPSPLAPSPSPSAQPQGAWACPPGAGPPVPPQLQGWARTPAGVLSLNNRTFILMNESSGESLTYCIDAAVPFNTTPGSETFILQVKQPAGVRLLDNSSGTFYTLSKENYICSLVRVSQPPPSGGLGPPPPNSFSMDRVPAWEGSFDNEQVIFNSVPCFAPMAGAPGSISSAVFCDPKTLPAGSVIPNWGSTSPLNGERRTSSCPFTTVPPQLWGRAPAPFQITGFADETVFVTAGGVSFTVSGVVMHDHCVQSARALDPSVSGVPLAWELLMNGTSSTFPTCLWMRRDPASNVLGVATSLVSPTLCPTSFSVETVFDSFFAFSAALPSPSASPGSASSPTPTPTPSSSSPGGGGGASPTSSGATVSPAAGASASPTGSPSVSGSVGASATPTTSPTPSPSVTGSSGASSTSSPTVSVSGSLTPTSTITRSPTTSVSPSRTSTATASNSSTGTSSPSMTPTPSATLSLSESLSASPTPSPTGTGSGTGTSSPTPSTSPSATPGTVAVGLSFALVGVQPPAAIANASVRAAVAAAVAGALAACDASPGSLVGAGLVSVTVTLAADTGSGAVLFSAGGGGAGGGTRRRRAAAASGVLAVNATALFSSAAAARAAMAAASNSSFAMRAAQLTQRPVGGSAVPAALAGGGLSVGTVAVSSSSAALAGAAGLGAGGGAPASSTSSLPAAAGAAGGVLVLLIVGIVIARRRAASTARKARKLTRAQSWAARKADSTPAAASADAYRSLVAGTGAGAGASGRAQDPRVLVASPIASTRREFEPQRAAATAY